jgi:hypothetical protein
MSRDKINATNSLKNIIICRINYHNYQKPQCHKSRRRFHLNIPLLAIIWINLAIMDYTSCSVTEGNFGLTSNTSKDSNIDSGGGDSSSWTEGDTSPLMIVHDDTDYYQDDYATDYENNVEIGVNQVSKDNYNHTSYNYDDDNDNGDDMKSEQQHAGVNKEPYHYSIREKYVVDNNKRREISTNETNVSAMERMDGAAENGLIPPPPTTIIIKDIFPQKRNSIGMKKGSPKLPGFDIFDYRKKQFGKCVYNEF